MRRSVEEYFLALGAASTNVHPEVAWANDYWMLTTLSFGIVCVATLSKY